MLNRIFVRGFLNWYFLAVLALFGWAASDFAAAQSGGFPSRPKFSKVTISGTEVQVPLDIINRNAAADSRETRLSVSSAGMFTANFCFDGGVDCEIFMRVPRSAETATSVDFFADALTLNTKPIAQSGTFTATLVGCTTSPTYTVNWQKTGDVVTLYVDNPDIVCTSNSASFHMTGIPAALQPSTDRAVAHVSSMNDGAALSQGACVVVSTQYILFRRTNGPTGECPSTPIAWVASGSKAIWKMPALTYFDD